MATRNPQLIQSNFTLQIYKGIAYGKTFTWTDSKGRPVNLNGKVLSIKIKDVFSRQLELFSNASPTELGSKLVIKDSPNGVFRIQLSSAQTSVVVSTQGKWWLELYSGDDSELIYLGTVKVLEI